MSLYVTGTITGALNATTITGTGTKWSDAKVGITNGSVLFVSSNAGVDGVYQVKRIISDTSIELAQPIYKTFTNSKYSILEAESASTAAWSNQLAATLGYYQAQMDGWQQIMTGTGDVALTAPDGTKVTIKSFTELDKNKADLGVNSVPTFGNVVLQREAVSNTVGAGGIVHSQMWFKGSLIGQARLYHEFRGDGFRWTTLSNEAGGKGSYLGLREDGYIVLPGLTSLNGLDSRIIATGQRSSVNSSWDNAKLTVEGSNLDGGFLSLVSGRGRSPSGYSGNIIYGVLGRNDDTWPNPAIAVAMNDRGETSLFWNFKHARSSDLNLAVTGAELTVGNSAGGSIKAVQWAGTSDERLKHDIIDNDGSDSFNNIMALNFTSFIYKADDKKRIRRGIIAQQAKEIDSDYVKLIEFGQDCEFDSYVIDNNPIVMDLIGTVQVLNTKIKEQDIKINEQEKRLLALEKMKDLMDE